MPGGDASIRRPYRIALALLESAGITWEKTLDCVNACSTSEKHLLSQQLTKKIRCVPTSSMGRLFDGVASMLGIRHTVNYEAQAAMEMESLATEAIGRVDPEEYSFDLNNVRTGRNAFAPGIADSDFVIGTRDLIRKIVDDVRHQQPTENIAAKFHHAVAQLIVEVAKMARDQTGCRIVGLTGGVFQNRLLVRLAQERLLDHGFEVVRHAIVPPNDGGIALGQAIVGRKDLLASKDET